MADGRSPFGHHPFLVNRGHGDGSVGGRGGEHGPGAELLRLDDGGDLGRGLVQEVQERLGVDADPEAEGDQGDERRQLSGVQVDQVTVLLVRQLAPEDPLVEPEQVKAPNIPETA